MKKNQSWSLLECCRGCSSWQTLTCSLQLSNIFHFFPQQVCCEAKPPLFTFRDLLDRKISSDPGGAVQLRLGQTRQSTKVCQVHISGWSWIRRYPSCQYSYSVFAIDICSLVSKVLAINLPLALQQSFSMSLMKSEECDQDGQSKEDLFHIVGLDLGAWLSGILGPRILPFISSVASRMFSTTLT